MTSVRPRRMLRIAVAVATSVALAACSRVIASAPPETAPLIDHEIMVAESRVVVSARAARALYTYQFITKRFGTDSTWGYRASDSTHARFRYRPAQGDSTRVVLEVWGGRCEPRDQHCLRADVGALLTALVTPEPPPS